MLGVATFIGSAVQALTSALAADADLLIQSHTPYTVQDELAPNEAVDIFFEDEISRIRDIVTPWAIEHKLDVIVQPSSGRRKKALLADMESTIIHQEMLDELAVYAGKQNEIKSITARAMNNELDFKEALQARLALLKGVPEKAIRDLNAQIRYMGGARELIATLRHTGVECALVSSGFTCFTSTVAATLGFQRQSGNMLDIENGVISGRMIEPVLDKDSKLSALHDTSRRLAAPLQDICTVGDGANDIPMLQAAGLGIAFHGKPAVRSKAEHNIRFADLRAVLWAQGYHRDELVD